MTLKTLRNFTILYSFNGRKAWGDVSAPTAVEARRAFMRAHRSDNVQILDVSIDPVLTVCR